MFAINHAATALVIKRRYPRVSMVWLLLSVQLVEIVWVLLNFAGVERVHTEPTVNSVADIHLSYMPYSHSIASSVALGLLAWLLLAKLFRRPEAGAAVAIGIVSHIVLDVLTHTQDIAAAPFQGSPRFGLGLYDLPLLAFVVETAYGLTCWRIFRGSTALLGVIILFNMANVSFFAAAIHGPEGLFANRAGWLVAAIAVQIAITLAFVWYFSRGRSTELEGLRARTRSATA
jgi:membrane-bound metal-dependent hydrolase YbcI (DUF457 family)